MEERTNVAAVLLLAAVIAVIFSGLTGQPRRSTEQQRGLSGARYTLATLPQAAPLRFAAGTSDGDRRAVVDVLARARPEARRLVDSVTGLVTVSVRPLKEGVAGQTTSTSEGYDVALDLGRISRAHGARGIARVTLHELGHVVDGALVPAAIERELDLAVSRGWGCDGGRSGACADRAERFAESFSKWATGDIGADIYIGYRVPPPVPLDTWGNPLSALAD